MQRPAGLPLKIAAATMVEGDAESGKGRKARRALGSGIGGRLWRGGRPGLVLKF